MVRLSLKIWTRKYSFKNNTLSSHLSSVKRILWATKSLESNPRSYGFLLSIVYFLKGEKPKQLQNRQEGSNGLALVTVEYTPVLTMKNKIVKFKR